MARIACVLMPGGAGASVRDWVLYHAYLFGFENLHILVHDIADPEGMAGLQYFAALGATLHRRGGNALDPSASSAALADLIGTFKPQTRYDLVLPLTAAEFVLVNGPEAINCSRSHILAEINRIAAAGTPARTAWGFESLPESRHVFRYVPMRHCVVPVASFAGFDAAAGTIDSITGVPESGHKATCLQVARLHQAHQTGHSDKNGNAGTLLTLRALSRALSVLADPVKRPAEMIPADPAAPTAALVIDLDRCGFANTPYLAANPDVAQSSFDPLLHFVLHGYLEGRTVRSTLAGARDVFDRMAIIREWRPDGTLGYANLAYVALYSDRVAQAETIVVEALQRFGQTPALLREHALCASHGATDAQNAAQRWCLYLAHAPSAGPMDYLLAANAQRAALHLPAARTLVQQGLTHHPADQALAAFAAELDKGAIAR